MTPPHNKLNHSDKFHVVMVREQQMSMKQFKVIWVGVHIIHCWLSIKTNLLTWCIMEQ